MSLRSLSAVSVIDRAPTEEEAAALATALINKERPGAAEDPSLEISWFTADELPPQGIFDLPLFERDQLEATRRDFTTSKYLIVMAARV